MRTQGRLRCLLEGDLGCLVHAWQGFCLAGKCRVNFQFQGISWQALERLTVQAAIVN